jgi:TM2 domain-containing membrane protein YozV
MDNKILYGIMTIIFNSIGVPCFMQGKTKAGILRIVLGVVTFGVISFINEIMGIIQGIKILCMSDEEYAAADKSALLMGVPSGK